MALGFRTAQRVLNATIDAQYLANNILFINSGPGLKHSISDYLDEVADIKGLQCKLELAHRLDKDCTGVLLLTRNKSGAQKLADLFRDGKVKKKYWTITVGVPRFESGKISIPVGYGKVGTWSRIVLRKDLIGKSSKEIRSSGFKEGITNFTVLDSNQSTCALCEINPETGYKQQIRVHLADGIQCPILGDHKFSSPQPQPQVLPLRLLQLLRIGGVKKEKGEKGTIRPWQRGQIPLHLHAREVVLPGLKSEKDLVITAPPPTFFEEALQNLKLNPKQNTIKQTRDEAEYHKLKRLGMSTKKYIGF